MNMEYDPARDLLYLYFAGPETRALDTKTISPSVHLISTGTAS